jgi:enoyl-CoA hydratase/3-hydroxyacyl-CoA dehydrogenase
MTTLKRVGIVGAGAVGSGIAQKIAGEGFDVVLIDTKPEYLEQALNDLRKQLTASETRAYAMHNDAETILSRIHVSTDPQNLEDVQIVFEAVPEDRSTKINTFKNIAQVCKKNTVLATSASSWPVEEVFKAVSHPKRCLGIHFFDHPAERAVAEVVKTPKTSDDVFERALSILRMLGISTIISKESPGYIVKRQQAAFLSEAVRLSSKRETNLVTIDAAARDAFGLSLGPFAMMNKRGIEIARHMSRGLTQQLGNLYTQPERLKAQEISGDTWPLDGEIDNKKKREIADRFRGLAILVGTAIASEGAAQPEDIDLGARLGLGWKKGPFELANDIGVAKATKLAATIVQTEDVDMPPMLRDQHGGDTLWPLKYVSCKISGEIATISINRPDVMNALSEVVITQIDQILDKIEADNAINVVVFNGSGKVLSSGLDPSFIVEKIKQNKVEDILAVHRLAGQVLARISMLPQTTIARADGLSMSAGIELGLACDLILAGPRATFVFPETGWGIHCGFGATQRLPRKVGKAIGKYILTTGEALDANSAFRLGIVDAVTDSEETIDTIIADLATGESLSAEDAIPTQEELATISLFNASHSSATLEGSPPKDNPAAERIGNILKEKAPVALKLVDKLIDDGLGLDLQKALSWELSSLELILQTKDALIGLESIGKGKPEFSGE